MDSLPTSSTRLHPMLMAAAVAVIVLCVTGVAALTGHLGGSNATPATTNAPAATDKAPAAAAPVAQAPTPAPQRPAAPIARTGTVVSVNRVDVSPPNNGVGAVAGGVLGGVAGHQIGNGRGQDVATVLGALGGALGGNEVERQQRRVFRYDVTIRADDGSTRTMHFNQPPNYAPGDRVPLNG